MNIMNKFTSSKFLKSPKVGFLSLLLFFAFTGLQLQATNYYTYSSGDWNTASIWTTDPTGLTSVAPAVPGSGDAVFVINNKVVTNTITARTVTATFIQANSTLDLGTITGNTLGTVSGLGLLKIGSTSFPSGTFTSFVSSSGGTIEYYNITGNLPSVGTYNNLIISNNTASANNCTFENPSNPTNYVINGNLTFNNSGSGSLQITLGNTATNVINFLTKGNIDITNGVTWKAGLYNAIHNIEVYKSVTNNGLVEFSNSPQYTASTNGAVNLKFSGMLNSTLSCNTNTNLYTLIVSKGIDAGTTLVVNAAADGNLKLYTDADAIQLITGTLKIGVNNTINRVNGGGLFSIPYESRLWIDGATMLLNASASGVEANGEYKITNGNFSIGNEGLILGLNGLISIDGGTSTVEKLRPIVSGGLQQGSFNITSGILNVDGTTAGTANADFPRFCLPYVNQGFYTYGGTINIANPETGTASGGGLLIGCSNYSTNNGNINLTIPASSTNFIVNSSIPLPTLNVKKAGAGSAKLILDSQPIGPGISLTTPVAIKPLTVVQDLILTTGNNPEFSANNMDVTISRNFAINVGTTYTPGNNTTAFNGNITQYFTISGTITNDLYNLLIDKPLTVSCFLSGSITTLTINNELRVLNGTFGNVTRNVLLNGNLYVATGLLNGLGNFIMQGSGAQTIGGNGTGRIFNLAINKTSGTTTLVAGIQIEGTLRLANGILDVGANTLTFIPIAKIYDGLTGTGTSFSNLKMVRTDGLSSNGGIRKKYSNIYKTFTYPLGTANKYTPASIEIQGTPNTYGFINIRAINSEHPVVTAANQSLTYYWKTSSDVFDLGAATVKHIYNYDETDVVTGVGIDESEYVAAYYLPNDVTWVTGDPNDVDETSNEIVIDPNIFGQVIDGEFTAGDQDPDDPFQSVIAFYSMRDGNWEDNSLSTTPWSTISHAGPPTSFTPGPKNPVFIGDGVSYNHTVTVTANGAKAGNLYLGGGSILDVGTKTGHNFSVLNGYGITGNGKLKISSSLSTAEFPAGDFGLFLGNSGGAVEYYTTGTSFTIPTVSALPTALVLKNYNSLTLNTEAGKSITMPDIDLTLFYIFNKYGTGSCYFNNASSKTLKTTGSMNFYAGVSQLRNDYSQTFNVGGGFNVYLGGTFEVANVGSPMTHILNHTGAISNNGTLDLNAGGGRVCDYFSTGTGNRTLYGTNAGAYTELNNFTVNRGVSAVNEYNFDLKGTLVTPTNNWLKLLNGTVKFSQGYNLTLTDQANSFIIPATAKLQVSHSSCVVNIGLIDNNDADLILNGKLQIDNGTVNIGSSSYLSNNDIEYSSIAQPEIEVKGGGALFVNGQIRRNLSVLSGSLTYKQADNSVVLINGVNAAPHRAKLEVTNFGSTFSMTGNSSLRFVRGGGTNFGDLYLHPTTNYITGGTILCQQGGIGSAQTYKIDATQPIYNLTINGTSSVNTATAQVINSPLAIKGTLLINNDYSIFNANGVDVNLLGNMVNNNSSNATGINVGGYRSGTDAQLTSFASTTSSQTLTGISGNLTNFANLKINNTFSSGMVTLGANSAIRVNHTLYLTKGTLADGGNTITSIEDIENNATHSSTGSGKIICQGTVKQFIGGDGNGKFGNLTIDNTAGVSTTARQSIIDVLNLNNGSLFIGANVLRLMQNASVTGVFGGFKMIQTNGVLGDSGVVKLFTPGPATFLFPVGTDVDYMPAQFTINNNTANGSIRVNPVKTYHPATQDPADKQLNYFWVVRGTGFGALNIDHKYYYNDIFVTGNEAAYVTGRYLNPNWVPTGGIAGTVNPTLNTMTLTGVNYVNGDYTCGETSEFTVITTLYSRNATLGGDWDDVNTWSGVGHAGPVAGITPSTQSVRIASGHTVTVSNDNRNCSSITINGTLDLTDKQFNVLGYADGNGLLRISASPVFSIFDFPTGDFNAFTASSGGTVEYYGTQSGVILPHSVYNNLIFSNSSNKTLSNVNITVNGALTINGGTVDNSVYDKNITIFKNWNNNVNSTAFDPGSGVVNFNGGIQTIGGSASTTFNTININGVGIKMLAKSIIANGNITINSGTFDVSSSNYAIDLKGNFTNNSTFNARSGLITLNGSLAQQVIGGTTATNFYDVTLNNPLGARLAAVQTLLNTLTCTNGTFDCIQNRLILKSTLTRTARIAPLTGGDIIGDITMERLAPGGTTGWAMLGTPVKNAKINQWTDDFPTSGFVGSTGNAGSFISIYTYTEYDLAPFDAPSSYAPITNAAIDPITSGVGYWVYLGTSYYTTTDLLIDVTGPTTKNDYDFGVTFSSSGNVADDGFNLVANPYPSTIDWDSPSWTKVNMEDAIYMWQADLSQYATYINGVSTNGASNLIPSSQGFFVKANALNPSLIAHENIKVAGNPNFIRTSGPSLTKGSLFRLKLEGNNFKDEAIIRFADQATVNFDGQYDAFKLFSPETGVPSISLVTSSKDLSINTLPQDVAALEVPVRIKAGVSGNYSLSFEGLETFGSTSCVIFEDLKTGMKTNIKDLGTYQFYMEAQNSTPRFIIHITKNPVLAVSNSSCSNTSDGSIQIKNTQNITSWTYNVKDNQGNTVASSSVSNNEINNLAPGTYQITYNNIAAQCNTLSNQVVIGSDKLLKTVVKTETPVEVSEGIQVNFVASAPAEANLLWNFGDGESIEAGNSVSHVYKHSGNYQVSLTVTDDLCKEELMQSITLVSDRFKANDAPTVTNWNEYVTIDFNFEGATPVKIQLTDVSGREVISLPNKTVSKEQIRLNTQQLSEGVYFINLFYNGKTQSTKVVR